MREPQEWERHQENSHAFFISMSFVLSLVWTHPFSPFFYQHSRSSYAKNLRFMSNSKKNEELQSRREFFKQAAKAALPVIGAAIMASVPFVKSEAATGCRGGCVDDCEGTCYRGCNTSCGGECKGSCQTGCYNGCRNTCHGTCSGGCATSAYA